MKRNTCREKKTEVQPDTDIGGEWGKNGAGLCFAGAILTVKTVILNSYAIFSFLIMVIGGKASDSRVNPHPCPSAMSLKESDIY